ncbi:hypothetical protein RSAG8_01807, partial [Rhizoctonia solani AG-8 WAC10335]
MEHLAQVWKTTPEQSNPEPSDVAEQGIRSEPQFDVVLNPKPDRQEPSPAVKQALREV